ncbi:WD40-repeat-containing domain protein [Neohortaea acidophila]|uniref:WD40-repeat-containing domain protein n=1 Tax=Neohortaea acidophila TaxID=245834 RepID=A0A6A6PY94_9PEZI|nr:WD40-repeat-containing domain protein [Neohortaea acidophila]KAF2485090.1 WD40-repeat-containing domain protein [Neohortaea acidophila]
MSGDFKLSATLKGHEEDVRSLAFPDARTLFSVSRDSTIRQWSLISATPLTYDDTIALQGSHWFNALDYAPPSKEHPSGLVAAGGRETFVFVKQVGRPPEEDSYRLLIGHAGNITCLAFSEDGNKIVSGGWDSQVFVWDVEQGSVVAELQGHQGPVWGVMVYDAKLIITACADKMIRIFDINGKSLKTIQGHTDVVRCFCKLPSAQWSGAAFASAGNDEVIRLWTLDGTPVGELEGHTAYIYSLATLPNGDIVSSSEDRTVRVWRNGACVQTIVHPAVSIWTVTACRETGDIATGASDKVIRIFSRDPSRQADAGTIAAFDETNRMYAIPAETASQGEPFQKENLPGPEALQSQVGHKDGQQLFIRENDGSVTAHLWSMSSSRWDLIGTVVSGQGSGSGKKTYDGKEYDFVFDIDIEEGKPPLKLPYNLTENPWDAARKFLETNKLEMSYYEQVANWITENTRGARLGQSTGGANGDPPAQARDPLGTERRYRPGTADSSSPAGFRKLPHRRYLEILEGNAQNAITRIKDASKELRDSGKISKESEPTTEELELLQKLVDQMHNSPRDPHPVKEQITALLKVCSGWPTLSRVPGVAVLARLAVSPSFIQETSGGTDNIVNTCAGIGLFLPQQPTANNAVHAIRLLVNLFASDAGLLIVDGSFDTILNVVRPFGENPESPAQFKALATLYLNFAVLLTSGAPPTEPAGRVFRADVLLTDIALLLESESASSGDSDALFKALCALGTLLTLGNDFRANVKAGVSGTLHYVATKQAAQLANIKEVIQEIRDELQ